MCRCVPTTAPILILPLRINDTYWDLTMPPTTVVMIRHPAIQALLFPEGAWPAKLGVNVTVGT